ncbi:hypothetical protein RchiOBHm_Chr5g0050981 [Rosa chinensis]|uniref:Uncharacterized protein n=1 Tax=Rosa chinensis TaxID=74649 RepID=A0A2P6QF95_ROSCH|nr:hypothetical protein RchiOBHm_Chr5g0050981 [Rosa chinensis]
MSVKPNNSEMSLLVIVPVNSPKLKLLFCWLKHFKRATISKSDFLQADSINVPL